ncbi:unnamed protein product [Ranitomeya imitator]|uniref:Reverse transcriptase domain-containing protein n=1 Tax=Ranitomeya imitator TaxID=111125 RepID=A0ABN9MGD8_9NEOB|nr:unnamed protein product [Ranitomeya imitator]
MDVNSLYTSISYEKGISASKSSLDLLRLVLYENFFLFENTYTYIQQQGTAMGSNVAPVYTNAFMNSFEESFVYTDDRFKQHISCYLRYIDDIFFIWVGPTDLLLAFHQSLNSIYPELQFTMHYDLNRISFLDTLGNKDDQGHLSTDVYSKPTDCNLLHYSSSHPKATWNSLPRSQFTRVAKIVLDPDILPVRLEDMSKNLGRGITPNICLTMKNYGKTANDKYELWKLGITHVLNAAHGRRYSEGNPDFYGTTITYHGVPANDVPEFDMSKYFYSAAAFIHKALTTPGGKSLKSAYDKFSNYYFCYNAPD